MSKRTIVLLQPKIGDMDDFRDRPTPPLSLISAAVFLQDCSGQKVIIFESPEEGTTTIQKYLLRLDRGKKCSSPATYAEMLRSCGFEVQMSRMVEKTIYTATVIVAGKKDHK